MTLCAWDQPRRDALAASAAVVRLPPLDELARKWARIEPMLEKATRRTGCYEPIDLLQGAMSGRYGIWLCESYDGIDAAIVTEIVDYPRKRILEMMFVGGTNMSLWLPEAIRVFDEHARKAGCAHIACLGRRSWARAWGGAATGDVVVVRGLDNVHG